MPCVRWKKLRLERYGLVNIVRRNEFREETGHHAAETLKGIVSTLCSPFQNISKFLIPTSGKKYFI